MIRVIAGVFANQGPSLEPMGSSVRVYDFAKCIVHNMPSEDKGIKDVKNFKGFPRTTFKSCVRDKSYVPIHSRLSRNFWKNIGMFIRSFKLIAYSIVSE